MGAERGRKGLDALNLFVAAVQTGFGPFIAVFLSDEGWTAASIGFAISVGTVAGMVSQIPAGALIDQIDDKRLVTAISIGGIGASAVMMLLWPTIAMVMAAQVLHAFASSMTAPAIASLTLSLYGHDGFGISLGRNARFSSIGGAGAAALIGAFGSYASGRGMLLVTALLAIPALAAVAEIGKVASDVPDRASPQAAPARAGATTKRQVWNVFLDRGLNIFGISSGLFFLGNAAMLPLLADMMARQDGRYAALSLSVAIILQQVLVAVLSPWVGRAAERYGRRPLLLLGFAAQPLRGILFAVGPSMAVLAPSQMLDGISGSVFGVMVPLIAADLTRRRGAMNLSMGAINLAIGLGAALSNVIGGAVATYAGSRIAFLFLAGAGVAATALLFWAMPETAPKTVQNPSGESA